MSFGLRILDRYLLASWIRIFVLTAVGLPTLVQLIKLSEESDKLLERGLTTGEMLLSRLYALPAEIAQTMPAAVLFATVFTLVNLGRHNELTAAKATGQSFYRLALPLFLAAGVASGLTFVVSEAAPLATQRQLEIERSRRAAPEAQRWNFVYRGEEGWVYAVRLLDANLGLLRFPVLEREGTGAENPGIALTADSASWDSTAGRWRLVDGSMRFIAAPDQVLALQFATLEHRALDQTPAQLQAEAKDDDAMNYRELGAYIDALRRSGNATEKLEVRQALKIAIPATCLVIALFGAPLAVAAPRQGPAVGVAISLATTVVFLLLVQLSQAVGAGGLMDPVLAAWLPNILFLTLALVVLRRVRT